MFNINYFFAIAPTNVCILLSTKTSFNFVNQIIKIIIWDTHIFSNRFRLLHKLGILDKGENKNRKIKDKIMFFPITYQRLMP